MLSLVLDSDDLKKALEHTGPMAEISEAPCHVLDLYNIC